jgi:hypothetical protein
MKDNSYEQGLLDGAKLMFKLIKESFGQLEHNLFSDVDTFDDIERKIKEKEKELK